MSSHRQPPGRSTSMVIVGVAAVALSLAARSASDGLAARVSTVSVTILGINGALSFSPNPVSASQGDLLAWDNTAGSAMHRIVLDDGSLDTGVILPGTSSVPTRLTTGGGYHCAIHPSMVGTITVNGPTPTPAPTPTPTPPPDVVPTSLVAVATSTSAARLTWVAAIGAASYQVFRSANNGPYSLVGSPAATSLIDTGLTAGTAYLYQVRAVDAASVVSAPSNVDLATTILFTDDPIGAGSTPIQALHVTELRTAVNAVRAAAGLPAVAFAEAVAPGALVKAGHITELRTGLDAAIAALGLPAVAYTDPALAAGDAVKGAHIQELRTAVK